MKCLILGDLHVGRGISIGKPAELGNLNSRIQDQEGLLDWALDLCTNVHKDLKHIVVTGDVYQDYRPPPAIISIFMRWLMRCEEAGVEVHIVMGNHDIIRSGQYVTSALDLVTNLEMKKAYFHKEMGRLELDDFSIVFIPFRDKRMYEAKDKEEALAKLKAELDVVCEESSSKKRVGIGHFAFEGSLSIGDEISDQLNEIFVPPDMFSWFDYVWMGHIHHPHVIQYEEPYCAHIGSLDKSDFSKTEVNNPKVAILLDSSNPIGFEEITIPTRPLRPVKITVPLDKDSTEFVINDLCVLSKTLEFNEAIVRIDITLTGSDLENVDREKVEEYLYSKLNVHHICGFSESRNISNIQINPEDSFDNMGVKASIKKWASTREQFEDDDERNAFQAAAVEICEEYEDKIAK